MSDNTTKVELTSEMLEAANDYVSNAVKEAWIEDTASKCFSRLSVAVDNDPMPDMYMINTGLKARYLMTALVSMYFKQEYEADAKDELLISEADYDRWAGSHIFGQIDRWKKDVALRNKCYDLLYDYHDLEKRLSSQLLGLLNVQNDTVLRQSQYNATQMKELPAVIEQLKELQEARAGNG